MEVDRIEVNGVWYVKEELSEVNEPTISKLDEAIPFSGIVFESDLYCFEVTKLEGYENYHDKDCTIKFTDKSVIHDIAEYQEHWDNVSWMNAFLVDEPEAIKEAMESLCHQGLVELKEVVTELAKVGWI